LASSEPKFKEKDFIRKIEETILNTVAKDIEIEESLFKTEVEAEYLIRTLVATQIRDSHIWDKLLTNFMKLIKEKQITDKSLPNIISSFFKIGLRSPELWQSIVDYIVDGKYMYSYFFYYDHPIKLKMIYRIVIMYSGVQNEEFVHEVKRFLYQWFYSFNPKEAQMALDLMNRFPPVQDKKLAEHLAELTKAEP